MLSVALLTTSIMAASSALGDVGPVIPGIMACSPPGGPPGIGIACDDGHNCCIMPVYDIHGNLLSFSGICCIKGSMCRSQRVGSLFIVFCEFPPLSLIDPIGNEANSPRTLIDIMLSTTP